jgi:hypothetical protein
MMRSTFKSISVLGFTLVSLFWLGSIQAMPSYARQTGLDCNSCHIGFDGVPNFTHVGRLFVLNGFHRPLSVRGMLREQGFDAKGNPTPEYGGHYLALNWTDFLSVRFVTTFASGSKSPGASQSNPTSSFAGGRYSVFFTGPVNDWLGVWTEVGYLGNDVLNTVNNTNPAGNQPTAENLYAYDEYRLVASWNIPGKNGVSVWGVTAGNEFPDEITEFGFPLTVPSPFNYGQGVVGHEITTSAYSVYGFWNDQFLTQYSIMTGDYDSSWSNGHNNYIMLGYDGIPGTGDKFRRQEDDLWWTFDFGWGNNFGSQLTGLRTSLICTTNPCPTGVSDAGSLSFTNTVGTNWDTISDISKVTGSSVPIMPYTADKWRLMVSSNTADWGVNSWVTACSIAEDREGYAGGSSSDQMAWGCGMRYIYDRTYGYEISYDRDFHYDYYQGGVKYAAIIHANPTFSFMWYPSMNFNVNFSYSPSETKAVLFANDYKSGGYSWSLGLDYAF